jgi:hypothetical protein
VPKYDAFGREIGEDPLAGLREATNPVPAQDKDEAAAARSAPVVWPDPVAAKPDPVVARPEPVVAAPEAPRRAATVPRIEFVRPRRRRRGLAGLLVLVAIVGGGTLMANAVVEESEDLIDRITPAEPEPAPTGSRRRSRGSDLPM